MLITGIGGGGTDKRQAIRDAIANFSFKNYNVNFERGEDNKIARDKDGNAIYASPTEIIDIVNDYIWTDRELMRNNFESFTSIDKAPTKGQTAGGEEVSGEGGEGNKMGAKISQVLRIPFAICIERKQTIASNVMNLLNLFASGIDSVNLIFSDENKNLTLGENGLANFNNNHKTITEIFDSSKIEIPGNGKPQQRYKQTRHI